MLARKLLHAGDCRLGVVVIELVGVELIDFLIPGGVVDLKDSTWPRRSTVSWPRTCVPSSGQAIGICHDAGSEAEAHCGLSSPEVGMCGDGAKFKFNVSE